MPVLSRQFVLKKLAAAFPDAADAEQALASLDRYQAEAVEGTATVHLAIIKLSEGKLWKLRELVQTARADFRDVLFQAQSPEYFRQIAKKPRAHEGWSWCWGMLPPKRPSPKKAAAMAKKVGAMHKRDQKQWLEWLSGIN
jgi:hypothetical protein